jgi:ribonuclease III
MTSATVLSALQKRLGYKFRQPSRLLEALTHPSYLQDHPAAKAHNQRLEFLGDSVLHFVLTNALYTEFPAEREGVLSRRRAVLTKGGFLTQLARDLGVDAGLLLSKSEAETGGRTRASILEDAIEAIIGAIYLDSDLPTVQAVILKWYGPLAARLSTSEPEENPKGRLQEIVQPVHGNSALRYNVTNATGPRHAREYEVTVLLIDEPLGSGRGTSKKAAEEAAARAALTVLAARTAQA